MKRFLLPALVLSALALAFAGCADDYDLPPLVDSFPKITPESTQAYEAALRARNLHGYAMIRVRVAADGHVARATAEGGSTRVMQALLPLAPTWKFQPAMREGKPVTYTFLVRAGLDDPAAPPDPFAAWRQKLRSDPWAGPYLANDAVDLLPQQISRGSPPRFQGLDGHLLVAFVVEADGTVRQARVLESTGGVAEAKAAATIVENWTYRPAEKSGHPVPHLLIVHLQFTPDFSH